MKYFLSLLLACALVSVAHSQEQDSPYRKELKRSDLTGTNMEVITSFQEMKPGDAGFLHIHHGEETFYVIEGGTVETPDGKQMPFPTGTVGINRRDVPHGAIKVVGDKPIKFITVHIVDKGAPLYDKPKIRGAQRGGQKHDVVERRPFADLDVAARKLVEIANGVEPVQDGRIHIEKINAPFLAAGGSGEDFRTGIERAIALGWLWRNESGTYLKFTDSGAALFACS